MYSAEQFYTQFNKQTSRLPVYAVAAALKCLHGITYPHKGRAQLASFVRKHLLTPLSCNPENLAKIVGMAQEIKLRDDMTRLESKVIRDGFIAQEHAELSDIRDRLASDESVDDESFKRFFRWARKALDMKAGIEA